MSQLVVAWALLRGIVWGLRRDDAPRVMTLVRHRVPLSGTTYRIKTPITLGSNQTLKGAGSTIDASGMNKGAAVHAVGHDIGVESLTIVSAPLAFLFTAPDAI